MRKQHILIVDDIPDNIKVLNAILGNEEYEITSALNGKDAIMLCISNSFDLILLDIMMPEMDGYEVCRYLKSKDKTKDIPIIFLTAKVDKDSIVQGFEVGAQDYVTKPFNPRELVARVKTHLELKQKNESLKFMNLQLEEKVAARTLELEEMNKSLEEANIRLSSLEEAKNDFLSLMSEELREPLTGIVGFADMLEFSIKNKTHLKYIRFIKEACEKLVGVSDMALLLSALRFDRYQMNLSNHSVQDLVDQAVENLTKRAEERKIQVRVSIPEQLEVKGDEQLLRLSLEKVLENALEYAPARSYVRIGMEELGRKLRVWIVDEGPAFSTTDVNYSFHFFSPSGSNGQSGFKRYSPGLVVVKLIMDLHNASVDVENLDDGGVKVSFLLPKQ
ncbi:MAG: response regulator [Marinifilaceae bacterium]|jgi:DNA-binding response OmpR family regulator